MNHLKKYVFIIIACCLQLIESSTTSDEKTEKKPGNYVSA